MSNFLFQLASTVNYQDALSDTHVCFETQKDQTFNLLNDYASVTCGAMTVSGPVKVTVDGTTIENLIIIADPTSDDTANDQALRIVAEDVTVRNVLIYHAANGQGIYGYNAHRLSLENVQVIAYGNAWGAQPCPSRSPFLGYDCSNIKIAQSDDVTMDNIYTEAGSRGISLVKSPRPVLTDVVSINPRGPQPGGQCF